jgi:hypothetical protein
LSAAGRRRSAFWRAVIASVVGWSCLSSGIALQLSRRTEACSDSRKDEYTAELRDLIIRQGARIDMSPDGLLTLGIYGLSGQETAVDLQLRFTRRSTAE